MFDGTRSSEQHAPPLEASAAPSYRTAMADVARRFELFGRAATAGRYELAAYQLDEIGEAEPLAP